MLCWLSAIDKSWRVALRFRHQHVSFFYKTKNILILFATYVHMCLFAPLATCVLPGCIQTRRKELKLFSNICYLGLEQNDFPPQFIL